jgi:hypothetical protein
MAGSNQIPSVLNKVLGTKLAPTLIGAVLPTDTVSQAVSKLSNSVNQTSKDIFSNISIENDFISTTGDNRYFNYTSGVVTATGGTVTITNNPVTPTLANLRGIAVLSSGVGISSGVNLGSNNLFVIPIATTEFVQYDYKALVRVARNTVPTTRIYKVMLGMLRYIAGIPPIQGLYFNYNESIASTYQCVATAGGVSTTVTTGIAPQTVTVGTIPYTLFNIKISRVGSNAVCEYYIDNVLAATIDTNIPYNQFLGMSITLYKEGADAANTQNISIEADYVTLNVKLNRI